MGKNSTVIYHSYLDRFIGLNDEQFGFLIKCVLLYDKTGIQPVIYDTAVKIAWDVIKYDIDENKAKYENISKAREEAGAKGGKISKRSNDKQNKQLLKNKANKTNANKISVSDTDKDTDKDKEKEKDKEKKAPDKPPQILLGEFKHVKMTQEQYDALCEKYGKSLVDDKIASLDTHRQNKERKYLKFTDHYATIGNWCRTDKQQPRAGPSAVDPVETKL